jgi:hypothetical protein
MECCESGVFSANGATHTSLGRTGVSAGALARWGGKA